MTTLPDTLALGPVHITVTDRARSTAWYEQALGLVDMGDGALGDGTTPVVILHEDPEAQRPGRHAGLYHYALLFPSREELARALRRVAAAQTPIQGMSDHETHEAIYLPDPDGNGIELAADRPKEAWPKNPYAGGPQPLDVDSLLAAADDVPPTVGEGLRVGHVHLHVGDIDEALAFYRDLLGFEEQANLGSAAFVSAGGYHHHVGMNVWKGEGVPAPPPHTVGLHHWTVELAPDEVAAVRERVPDAEDADGGFVVRDPWGTAVAFVSRER